ncbi:subtilisin family serine protease [Kibdelosporangium banguiense]|uniref:Subtilisin family serine protease n=1 Tax=Kibdelosporangium banguiense TaxID=1365924 RepID=A0ABS4TFG9_9PSEU|nr:S8 family serine peptidase [Kibdelosporangium banguiense]MBP2322586.1 subtilisin family serine protease [Kibdelosporangium banguiense]
MSHKRSSIGVLTGLIAWGLAVPISGTANAAPITGTAPTAAPIAVTLFTGDKVILDGQFGARVQPAKGRQRTQFDIQKDERGDVHVIPADATGMLRSGRLDPRLFNVTQLFEGGYDDTNRKDVPLIVSGQGVAATKVLDLPSIQGAAVRVDKAAGLPEFKSVGKIWLDGPVRASLDKSVPQVGAPEAWSSGYTGKGATVAVLDSGIDTTHPDLADAVIKAENFTDATTGTDDRFGHGTHVASTITGNHAKYQGVAPETNLLNGKVLDDGGGGRESWIIAGMQWAAAQGADVVNMSLGSRFPSAGTDPMSLAVNRITAETGTLFVISAGNTGGQPGSPAAADAALTVGAVDHNDQLAPFSSRGPRWGDDAIKPDITAPGVDIAAAKATHGKIGSPVDATHVRLSGTSMAAPHVAGAAAILAQQHPEWKADQLKAALMASAKPNPALSVFEQGSGRLDVAKAVKQSVYTSPASVNAGVAQWPHNDDTPIKKTLTYHNSANAPVTANLTADVRGPAGAPAPTGMFTFSQNTITIPAGGQAQVEITIDTRAAGPDGLYSGFVLAGDVRTPIAVNREVESYNIAMSFLGMDGNPTPDYSTRFVNLDIEKAYLPYDASGSLTVRLPKGRFYFNARMDTTQGVVLASEPEYVVNGDTTFVIDSQASRPIGFTVDKPGAKAGMVFFGFDRRTVWAGGTGDFYQANSFDGFRVRPSTTTAAPGQFTFVTEGRLAQPDGEGGFFDSPYLYSLHHEVDGKVPAEPLTRVRDKDLAKVVSEHAATAPGRFGMREGVVIRALPYSLEEFYTPDFGWNKSFTQQLGPDWFADHEITLSNMNKRTYKRGSTTTERWNYSVLGPAFAAEESGKAAHAMRDHDEISLNIGMYADQAPGRTSSAYDTGSTTLYKDGKQIGRKEVSGYGNFVVPPGDGTYQLHIEGSNNLAVSSKIIADWTFKSGTVTGDKSAALPLLAVRFTPTLDNQNRAHRAVPTVVPVNIDHNTGGKAKPTAIQVSHDDGTTWKPAPVFNAGGKWFTVLVHPAGAKSVSLKASAKDAAGNSVEQTILQAFLLK